MNNINNIDDAIEYIKATAIEWCTEECPDCSLDPLAILQHCNQYWGEDEYDPKSIPDEVAKLVAEHYGCSIVDADKMIYDIELEAVAEHYGLTVPMLKILSSTDDTGIIKIICDNAIDKDKLKRMIKLYLDNNECTENSCLSWKLTYKGLQDIVNE